MGRAASAGFVLLATCVVTIGSLAGSASVQAADPTVQRFLSRSDEPVTQYRAVRHLVADNPKFKMHGSMDALTEMTPDGRFTFTVIREEGAEYIRNKVFRSLLANEQKLFATQDPTRSALTEKNYQLAAAEVGEEGLVKLLAKPKRRDVTLVDGALFVTPGDADLVRVEGRLAKNPSFWTTRVDLVRQYDRIAGLRVPVRLDTTAQVRLAGTSTLSVTYEYEMVNGVQVAR
jgi:hypothetical protein